MNDIKNYRLDCKFVIAVEDCAYDDFSVHVELYESGDDGFHLYSSYGGYNSNEITQEEAVKASMAQLTKALCDKMEKDNE